ncbi:hypothetical protein HBN54_001552 [Hymenobacter sp. 1B]|uniref:Uncharacterized protein n=1 Tax=Hymenobacter artigasi TaxID=2719616 RepID=A0ABX1HFG2_9BACT|nr:hypothetical protein [Hymenobacter artigasi]
MKQSSFWNVSIESISSTYTRPNLSFLPLKNNSSARNGVLARVAFATVLVAANPITFAHRNDFTQTT